MSHSVHPVDQARASRRSRGRLAGASGRALACAAMLALAGCGGQAAGPAASRPTLPTTTVSPTATPTSSTPSETLQPTLESEQTAAAGSPSTDGTNPSTEGADAATAALDAAARAARDAGSARVRFDVTTAGAGASGPIRGEGAFRTGPEPTLEITMRVPGAEQGTEELAVIVVGDTAYLRLPAEDAPAGKPWLRLAADDANPMADGLRPLIGQLRESVDPAQGFALLPGATSVERAGEERVEGVVTTRYDVTVDLERAVDALEGDAADAARRLLEGGATRLEQSVWIDGDGLPRQVQAAVEAQGGSVTSTTTYTDWGDAVEVSAPPADQVTTFAELG